MLAAVRVAKGVVRIPQRALVVAGQRQAAVSAVRRKQPTLSRELQSLAQTDRVSIVTTCYFSSSNSLPT